MGRRVYWLFAGTSQPDGTIVWGEPELALYWDGTGFEDRPDWNPDWAIVDGPGYPDFAELADGTLCYVESNKLAVRYHEVDPRLLAHLRAQPELAALPVASLVHRWRRGDGAKHLAEADALEFALIVRRADDQRRLVEAGVDVLTTSLSGPLCGRVGNWDDHAVNHHVFDAMKFRAEAYDQANGARGVVLRAHGRCDGQQQQGGEQLHGVPDSRMAESIDLIPSYAMDAQAVWR